MKFKPITDKPVYLPFIIEKVSAGFPSPAAGYEEERLNINDFIISNPEATYYIRAKGDSMINAGIKDGDILVVDKSVEPRHGSIVIALIDGEFTVKTLYSKDNVVKLVPANSDYQEIILKDMQELEISGVVMFIVSKLS